MWGALLVLALLMTVNPIRIGIMLLVLSRPRPMPNLFAYWVGTLLAGVAYLFIPLILLHSTPALASFATGFMRSEPAPGVQKAMIGLGVVLLLMAALLAVRSVARSPHGDGSVPNPPGEAKSSTLTVDPATLPIISRLVRPAPSETPSEESRGGRLLDRARESWQKGSPWIALVLGLMVMPADGILLALALIVASGADLGTQLAASVGFVIVALAVEEVLLISNLLVPDKTRPALRRLHDWSVAHHRKFMAAILALVGVSLIIQGMGGL